MTDPSTETDARIASRATLPIIAYHFLRAADSKYAFGSDEAPYVLDDSDFRNHLEGLSSAGFAAVSVSSCLSGDQLPSRPAVIAFDDGHISFQEVAVPVLLEHNCTATLFVPTDFIGRSDHLTRVQLQELSHQGIEVGSHGCSHRALTAMPEAEMREELVRSKGILEDLTGSPVQTLALPHGFGSRGVDNAARAAGYRAICTSRFGLNSVPCSSFHLNRIGTKNSPSWEDMGKLMQPGSSAYRRALLMDRTKEVGKWLLQTHKRCR